MSVAVNVERQPAPQVRKVYVTFYDHARDTGGWRILRGTVGEMVLLARNEYEAEEHWQYVNTREIRSMR